MADAPRTYAEDERALAARRLKFAGELAQERELLSQALDAGQLDQDELEDALDAIRCAHDAESALKTCAEVAEARAEDWETKVTQRLARAHAAAQAEIEAQRAELAPWNELFAEAQVLLRASRTAPSDALRAALQENLRQLELMRGAGTPEDAEGVGAPEESQPEESQPEESQPEKSPPGSETTAHQTEAV